MDNRNLYCIAKYFEGEKVCEFHEFLQLHENIIHEKRWALIIIASVT